MNCPTLANLLSGFFLRYLADERGVSPNTTASYRDSVKLLLQYTATRLRRSVDRLAIEDLTSPFVLDFLVDLETNRGNTTRTRNCTPGGDSNFLPLCCRARAGAGGLLQPGFSHPQQESSSPRSGLPERAGTRSPAGTS